MFKILKLQAFKNPKPPQQSLKFTQKIQSQSTNFKPTSKIALKFKVSQKQPQKLKRLKFTKA
ncbi:hypothetical protein DMC01_12120 [Campylobacter troglodytis]|nr:hypothetical protein DMC01_12120 [Campylobacter troglodytis]